MMPVATASEYSAVLGRHSALPFVLGTLPLGREESQIQTILGKLEALEAVAVASRTELDGLRQMSKDILRAIEASQAASPRPAVQAASEPEASRTLRLQLFGSFAV